MKKIIIKREFSYLYFQLHKKKNWIENWIEPGMGMGMGKRMGIEFWKFRPE